MNKYPQFKTLYFDGFAGSGDIFKEFETNMEVIKGTAIRVLEIETPKTFDTYYFVEKNELNRQELLKTTQAQFSHRKDCHIVQGDCNKKLEDMVAFLRKQKNYRVLAFIDPYGMSVNWSSLEILKGYGIDLWILVPTGMGLNRLLKRNGDIEESWLNRLEIFLGISRLEIMTHFYKTKTINTLFGEETDLEKDKNTILKAGELYKERLNTIFQYVSEPFLMKNSSGTIMYHFMMATNNKAALRIANDVIKPKFK